MNNWAVIVEGLKQERRDWERYAYGKVLQPQRSFLSCETEVTENHGESDIFVQGQQERLSDNLNLALC